jgi:hypothetical protein|tara:strand:- start:608 stop:1165 length:558 start_codon:yes stop_codon:yes gene_type:complete
MNMNQKTKYYLNLILIIFLLIIYIYDAKYVRRDIEIFETAISDIDMQLEAGSEVINDMNQVRQDFIKNKNTLAAYQISGNELMKEIQNLNLLADEMDIVLDDLEIDPRNTFPNIDQGQDGDQIVLERQSLSFNLSGNFLDIGTFIDAVQDNSPALRMQYCSIILDSLDPRGVIAELEYLTYGGPE